MNKKIQVFPHIWLENPSVSYILSKFIPTLKDKVFHALETKGKQFDRNFLLSSLPNNDNLISNDILNLKQKELILNLEILLEINEGRKPIVIIMDDCFTNTLLLRNLAEILWMHYEKFVDIVEINFENYTVESELEIKQKVWNNSLIMIWGSFSDTYTIPDNMYNWYLPELIKNISKDQVDLKRYNNKLIWICFWQQYIANLMGIDRIYTEKIITTIKWPAQFWVMPLTLSDKIESFPYMYREILNWITNYWQNTDISTVFTRTGHVDFNLLNSYTINSSSILPLMKDKITDGQVIWWTRNWNILGVQPHFEIDMKKDLFFLENQLNQLIPLLTSWYSEEIANIIWNLQGWIHIKNSLWQIFFTYSINEMIRSLVARHKYIKQEEFENPETIVFPSNFREELETFIVQTNIKQRDWKEKVEDLKGNRTEYLKALEQRKKLKMLTVFDWKINRWENQVSDTLWLIDLVSFIKEHSLFLREEVFDWWENKYVFRDFWAWNWALVKQIDKLEGVNAYWVGDYAYFDLYDGISKNENFSWIPEEVKKLFVYELISNLHFDEDKSILENIKSSLQKIDMNRDEMSGSSMFETWTKMFDEKVKVSNETKLWINANWQEIERLKKELENNFYSYIEWYFEKLLISDFNSLYIKESHIKKVDFQTAIRSTSHIDALQLKSTLSDYIKFSAKPWSIYFDNWVIRSYTSVPRIKEYLDLERENKWVKVYFVFDTKSNYIASSIVLKEPFYSKENIEKHLKENYILLTPEEVYNNSFFRIERFIRELLILSFKDYKIFYNKNQEIINFLKFLSKSLKEFSNKNVNIKRMILIFLNKMINDVNLEFNERYNKMVEKDLDFYISKIDEEMKDILNWKIEIQDWFNMNFERNN